MRRKHSRLVRLSTIVLIAVGLVAALPTAATDHPSPSFDDRVRCQRAVEEVYWRHRIWPAQNPGPKPALDELLSEEQIRERVTSYLQKGTALEIVWQRPLTGEQLQAELDRMVRQTRSPELLRELFLALDDDPFLAAECLARPALTERLTRSWYKHDSRFHGSLRAEAEAALAIWMQQDDARLEDLGGTRAEIEWLPAKEELKADPLGVAPTDRLTIDLSIEDWRERVRRLAASFGIEPEADAGDDDPSLLLARIPLGHLSPLVETDSAFVVTYVISAEPDRVRARTVHWPKRAFDDWWREEGRSTVQAADVRVTIAPPAVGYALRSPDDTGCTADTWTRLWWAPTGRDSHTAVWTGSEMIVWGGWGSAPLNTGGRYDPATDTWAEVSMDPNVPAPREEHTAVWTGTEMIVWGGTAGPTVDLDSGGRYDPVTNSWTATSTGAGVPEGRWDHTAVWTGTEMIVWGGHPAYCCEFDTGGRYDPLTDSWTPTSTATGVSRPRYDHTAVWTGSEMIVWGGWPRDDETIGTGGRYDPVTDSWTATSTGSGAPSWRYKQTALWTGTEMIIWGGHDGATFVNSGGRYDPVSDTWAATSTGTGVPSVRFTHSVVWTGTEVIVWGGYNGSASFNTGGRYDPTTDAWTVTGTGAGTPTARSNHSAVWTGAEMIVWGGYCSSCSPYRVDSGGRYDPVTDSWVATPIGLGRKQHEAVWTGTEMIVWGGLDDTGVAVDSGGRFDPATASWTETSRGAGVPPARCRHAALWSGTEMIVWGGDSSGPSTAMNTGGRYDAAADSWTATSMTGAPAARTDFAAVWTGTEMIVWGGIDDDTYLNSGGRYDPATDSWSATSTAQVVPSQRASHTAVWTGTEMIVWGGDEGVGGSVNTGSRYNPSVDVWEQVSNGEGVPSEKHGHHAVWTGTEMIVWGGPDHTGGRYDPATDNWTATSTGPDVPEAQEQQTVVWTGTEMIVWGGGSTPSLSAAGARYDPVDDSWIPTPVGNNLPTARGGHTAIWTGTEMIVWGGNTGAYPTPNAGDLYCACDGYTVSLWYPDADGDGYGADSTAIHHCEQPPGHIADGGDCDDLAATCIANCDDLDFDGIADCADTCVDLDGDGYGDPGGAGFACLGADCDDSSATCNTDCATDDDVDLVPDCRDNCPGAFNPAQTDADLDGWGEGDGCDCDDSDPDTFPDAPEVNDGLDNQCPGDNGYGTVDEISGLCGFHNPDDADEFSWPAQPGAASYQVARASDPLISIDCSLVGSLSTYWSDATPVPDGSCFYYLVRPLFPNGGSWGAGSDGAERTAVCP